MTPLEFAEACFEESNGRRYAKIARVIREVQEGTGKRATER